MRFGPEAVRVLHQSARNLASSGWVRKDTGTAEGAMIEVHELARHFGAAVAVHGLDLTVTRGEVFGFLGPNGVGKTTPSRCCVGCCAQLPARLRSRGWIGSRMRSVVPVLVLLLLLAVWASAIGCYALLCKVTHRNLTRLRGPQA